MARARPTVEVIPSARRLIRSLRDVGYDFTHSVADLVDNSIAAGASVIAIEMRFEGKNSWLRVSDNGAGMSGTTITEAMRFGTEREYEDDELGKFGLGLKTASLSQCSRLTVASRTDRTARRIEVRQWDLEHVEATNRWEIIDLPADERPDALIEPLQTSAGTVVLWERMDRVLEYKIPWGDRAKTGFFTLADELDLHLGMVFHRFLAGQARRKKKLKITLNGTPIEPWDPYARDERATVSLPPREFKIHGHDGPGIVGYTPFILPQKERFSSLKAFNRYSGPAKWNYQQGFYIYRADRMIQSGGWCYMRTVDEHTKFARVAIDFWPDLDSAFDLNVAKARVNLPADLKAALQPNIEQLVKQARKVYSPTTDHGQGGDSGGRPAGGAGDAKPAGGSGGGSGRPSSGHGTGRADTGPADDQYSRRESIGPALEKAAKTAGETKALRKIRKALKTESPDAAKEIGW